MENKAAGFASLLVCIVLYNKKLSASETFVSLAQHLPPNVLLTVLVYDNSLEADSAIEIIKSAYSNIQLLYTHNAANPGLAVAYNHAAAIAAQLQKDTLVLFDQDSTVPPEYFNVALLALANNPAINLFSPAIVSKGIIISPSQFLFGRAWAKKEAKPGITASKNSSIINSGIIIRLAAFNKLGGYDEALSLDYSDHYFFYKYKTAFASFFVLPISINHELSTFFDTDYTKVFGRFATYFAASLLFAQKTNTKAPLFWSLLRAFKLSVVFKRASFIKYAVGGLLK
ncbi:glycosyltransferase [Parasediminibacterium sp. JCM 36343]|uniref:glycosyltransferase n=1 Tax=Parasediminibacterium sp. JCM 36343 TaxID=3374279 RepID=UPI0039783262